MSCNVSEIIKNHAIYIQSHFSCKDVFEGLLLCKINLTRDYDRSDDPPPEKSFSYFCVFCPTFLKVVPKTLEKKPKTICDVTKGIR